MLLPIKMLSKRFGLSMSRCFTILQKEGIRCVTLSGTRKCGGEGYYEEKEAVEILRKEKERNRKQVLI